MRKNTPTQAPRKSKKIPGGDQLDALVPSLLMKVTIALPSNDDV